jgi:hypothetical protein
MLVTITPSSQPTYCELLRKRFLSWNVLWILSTLVFLISIFISVILFYGRELLSWGKKSVNFSYMLYLSFALLSMTMWHSCGIIFGCMQKKRYSRSTVTHVLLFSLPLGYSALLYAFLHPIQNPHVFLFFAECSGSMFAMTGIWVWALRGKGDYRGPFWFLRLVGPFPETRAEVAVRLKKKSQEDREAGNLEGNSVCIGADFSAGASVSGSASASVSADASAASGSIDFSSASGSIDFSSASASINEPSGTNNKTSASNVIADTDADHLIPDTQPQPQ